MAERTNAAVLKTVDPFTRTAGSNPTPSAVMPEPFVHTFRVRYHECDAQGIVFNANWLSYFDVTLTEWFRAMFGSYGALVEIRQRRRAGRDDR